MGQTAVTDETPGDDLYARYGWLRQFVGWTPADAERVARLAALLDPALPEIVDDFYAAIERDPAARQVITGGPAQVERLKGALLRWLRELLGGCYDKQYVLRRWRIGWRHVEIGLDQVYASVAFSRLRTRLLRAFDERLGSQSQDSAASRQALSTLLDLDMAIIQDAYQHEFVGRLQLARLHNDLQRRMRELEALLDVIPVGIAISYDPACQRVRRNKSYADLMGLPTGGGPEGGLGDATGRFFHAGEELALAELPLQRAAAGEEVRDVELDVLLPGDRLLHLSGSAIPLLDEAGSPRGSVAVLLDLTERKRTQERALQTSRLAAIGETMAGLVHESRNALQRSKACLEMLALEVQDRPDALDLIARIQRAQDHLATLYEEVRQYAAPIKVSPEPTDLAALVRESWSHLALQSQAKQLRLATEASPPEGVHCPVDPFHLGQAIRNIMENAIDASPVGGTVWVRWSAVVFGGRPAWRLAIRDEGPGVAAANRGRVFDPFFTTKNKGTGLGMAIAQRLVQAHGGEITLSPCQPGAEFIVTLPRGEP